MLVCSTNPFPSNPAILAAVGQFPSTANQAIADGFCKWVALQSVALKCFPASGWLGAAGHRAVAPVPLPNTGPQPPGTGPASFTVLPALCRANGYKKAVSYVLQPYAGWSWTAGTISQDGKTACSKDKCPGFL